MSKYREKKQEKEESSCKECGGPRLMGRRFVPVPAEVRYGHSFGIFYIN